MNYTIFSSIEDAKKCFKPDMRMYLDDMGETLPDGSIGYWIGTYNGGSAFLRTHRNYKHFLTT